MEHMEKLAAHLDTDRPADRLEKLAHALLEVVERLRGDHPETAFESINGEHFKTIENLVLSRAIAMDLLDAAHSIDAEGN